MKPSKFEVAVHPVSTLQVSGTSLHDNRELIIVHADSRSGIVAIFGNH